MSNQSRSGKLSLSRELLLLAGNAEALRWAAERVIDPSRPRETLQHFAAAMAGGLLVLRDRLRLVERVVMGIDNPAVSLCRANEADPSEEGPGVFQSWSGEDVVERCLAEYRGAKNRLAWERRDRGPQSFVLHRPDERKDADGVLEAKLVGRSESDRAIAPALLRARTPAYRPATSLTTLVDLRHRRKPSSSRAARTVERSRCATSAMRLTFRSNSMLSGW